MPCDSHTDLATLAQLAREGSLDLSGVAFRVRTDLMVTSPQPLLADIRSYTEFALAALPGLGERDLRVIARKLAEWPHTPKELKEALSARLPDLAPAPQRETALPETAQHAERSAEEERAWRSAENALRTLLKGGETAPRAAETVPATPAMPEQERLPEAPRRVRFRLPPVTRSACTSLRRAPRWPMATPRRRRLCWRARICAPPTMRPSFSWPLRRSNR
jgi:hypothetical protein